MKNKFILICSEHYLYTVEKEDLGFSKSYLPYCKKHPNANFTYVQLRDEIIHEAIQ